MILFDITIGKVSMTDTFQGFYHSTAYFRRICLILNMG